MSVQDSIRSRLEQSLAASQIEIIDESHRHSGHAGAKPGGETHFNVTIVSTAFQGKNRLARHRMVFGALKELMDAPIHALSIHALTPEEASSRQQP